MGAIQSNRKPSYDVNGEGKIFFVSLFEQYNFDQVFIFVFIAVNFDHFQILRAIGKGAFGKVKDEIQTAIWPTNFNFDPHFLQYCRCALFKRKTQRICMQ